jgi:ribosomal protein S18 acetylase RimI-like enzyme
MRHRSFKLECTQDSFKDRRSSTNCLKVIRANTRDAALCKRLWSSVGSGFWTERSRWGLARWRKQLLEPNISFWVASVSGKDVGCFELARFVRGVRIEGFGLLSPYRGQGLGRDLLTAATERAFTMGVSKIWLHTATDDHPNALPNYLSSGYRIIRERELKNPISPRSSP